MELNALGGIDYFDQIDDLINFPLDDESGFCNNLLLAGSTVDCKDFPIYMADDALIPDDCEPLLCRGRIDRSMPDVDLSAALFVPFEDIVRPEWPSTVDAPSGDASFQKETTILSGSNSSSSSSSGSNGSCSDEKVKIPLEPYRWGPQHARTKRPRPKNPYDPKSTINRLVMMMSPSSSPSSLDARREHAAKKVTKKIKITNDRQRDHEVTARKCLHCEITSTPQWRAGPTGPKTLCNACGVRYKSGRLYPEYRPAASPTFVSSLHSNSHKKVLEMRSKVGHGIEANDTNDATIEIYRD